MAAKSSRIKIICDGLQRYYESINAPYNGLFTTYCEDSGIESDALEEELNQEDPTESILADFDDKFPFRERPPNDTAKAEQKLKLMRQCLNDPRITFSIKMPKLNDLFHVTERELKETTDLYEKQCPVLWNSGMKDDKTFLYVLTVGRKHKMDYLQHLVDYFSRTKSQNIGKDDKLLLSDKLNKHLKDLTTLADIQAGAPYELATGAIKSFSARCCPALLYNPGIVINDSVRAMMQYLDAITDFIVSLITDSNQQRRQICPFQVDVCVASGQPTNKGQTVTIGNDEDDEDESGDDDEDTDPAVVPFVDIVGNIQEKLEQNKLKYKWAQYQEKQRIFANLFKSFKEECKLDDDQNMYPHHQRFIMFIDRRTQRAKVSDEQKQKEYDVNKADIWMYEPPANCRSIPRDTLPEWYINATRTCLLPNKEYGDGKAAESAGEIKQATKRKATAEQQRKLNIGGAVHCHGALLTFSFIVKESDAIKVYLYWNGQITRFFPRHCKPVLKTIFDMKWNKGANQSFMESKEMEELSQNIYNKLNDKYFQTFCNYFT